MSFLASGLNSASPNVPGMRGFEVVVKWIEVGGCIDGS